LNKFERRNKKIIFFCDEKIFKIDEKSFNKFGFFKGTLRI
jgi:hypothetical protein